MPWHDHVPVQNRLLAIVQYRLLFKFIRTFAGVFLNGVKIGLE